MSNSSVVYIRRAEHLGTATRGVLYVTGFSCYTLELPDLGNTPYISCIPAGKYLASVDVDTLRGGVPVIRLEDVPKRSGILIHIGNTTAQIEGCILVGYGKVDNPIAVTNSKRAMQDLLNAVNSNNLVVDIAGA